MAKPPKLGRLRHDPFGLMDPFKRPEAPIRGAPQLKPTVEFSPETVEKLRHHKAAFVILPPNDEHPEKLLISLRYMIVQGTETMLTAERPATRDTNPDGMGQIIKQAQVELIHQFEKVIDEEVAEHQGGAW